MSSSSRNAIDPAGCVVAFNPNPAGEVTITGVAPTGWVDADLFAHPVAPRAQSPIDPTTIPVRNLFMSTHYSAGGENAHVDFRELWERKSE